MAKPLRYKGTYHSESHAYDCLKMAPKELSGQVVRKKFHNRKARQTRNYYKVTNF